MNIKKEITIYDIAKKLQISAATVSRALKNHAAISESTRKKVQDAARKMGYRSNNFASNLRKQKTNTIGIIIHELQSNFMTSVLAGIEKITANTDFDLVIGHSSESAQKEIANAHNLFHKRVDGLIASLAFDTTDVSHFNPYTEKGIPVVFFDRVDEKTYGVKVVIDNLKAGYDAAAHLIDQGCKNIAHITANLKRNVYADRLKGYKKALSDHGQPYSKSNLIVTGYSEQESLKAAEQFLQIKPRPDGVFITNDFCAAVCIKAWKAAGLRIPEDIAVVGFNNDAISKIVEPSLTTINYNGVEIGKTAAKCLLDQLNGVAGAPKDGVIMLKSELVIRDSSVRKK
jgi:LacI family transcriptional regulator